MSPLIESSKSNHTIPVNSSIKNTGVVIWQGRELTDFVKIKNLSLGKDLYLAMGEIKKTIMTKLHDHIQSNEDLAVIVYDYLNDIHKRFDKDLGNESLDNEQKIYKTVTLNIVSGLMRMEVFNNLNSEIKSLTSKDPFRVVEIRTKGETVGFIRKDLLIKASPTLAGMFGDCPGLTELTFDDHNIDIKELRVVIGLINTSALDMIYLTKDDVFKFARIANKYEFVDLQKRCDEWAVKEFVITAKSSEKIGKQEACLTCNIFELAKIASECEMTQLKKKCDEWAVKEFVITAENFQEIWAQTAGHLPLLQQKIWDFVIYAFLCTSDRVWTKSLMKEFKIFKKENGSRLMHLDINAILKQKLFPVTFLTSLLEFIPNITTFTYNVNSDSANVLTINDNFITTLGAKCKRLRSLEISNCQKITNEGFQYFAKNYLNLEVLNVRGCKWVTDDILKIIAENCKNLKSINLHECKEITDEGLKFLTENCKKLERLSIGKGLSSHISNEGLACIAENCKNLKVIEMNTSTNIKKEGIQNIIKNCMQLEHLDLSFCAAVTDEVFEGIPNKYPNLKSIKLTECRNITNQSLQNIAKSCPNLESLNIEACYLITDDGLKSISKGCLNLRVLNIRNCEQITEDSLKFIAIGCLNLESLNIEGCGSIIDYKEINELLKKSKL